MLQDFALVAQHRIQNGGQTIKLVVPQEVEVSWLEPVPSVSLGCFFHLQGVHMLRTQKFPHLILRPIRAVDGKLSKIRAASAYHRRGA